VLTPVRIVSLGAAAPELRLTASDVAAAWGRGGGRGQAAVCAGDEDTLTLAAEAATRALDASGIEPGVVDGLWWGTTRPPFAEGPSHAVLGAALGLSGHSTGALCAGSPHAGMEALFGAVDAVAAGSAGVAVVVASDAILPGLGTPFEARSGAGAAALVVTAEEGPATVGARVTRTRPLLDRYRGDGEHETRDLYDARLFREQIFLPGVREVASQLATLEVDDWSLPDPDGRLGSVIGRAVGAATPASVAIYQALGDTGAAAALLGAAGALDHAGTVGLVGFGGGRVSGVVLTADSPVPGAATVADVIAGGRAATYAQVLRARRQLTPTGETVQMGVPPESAFFARGAVEMLELLGARCVDCGTINTPPSIHPHCLTCAGDKFEDVPLSRNGTVHTYVINHTMPAPFEAPLPLAVLDLDDGARVMLQVASDGTDIEIGSPMELVLRRYAHERGVPVYGYKARLAANDGDTDRRADEKEA
jgi:hydroxymethylglutaryl-CoA synthase